MKVAVSLALVITLAGCASGGQGGRPTFKNNTNDTLIYCETIGGSKECKRMQKGEAVQRLNTFLSSPRVRF